MARETGAVIPFNLTLAKDFLTWYAYYVAERMRALFTRASYTAVCEPQPIRAWYLWWGVFLRAGIRYVNSSASADFAVHFEDLASVDPIPPSTRGPHLNYACTDITKSKVAAAFAEAFGYELGVDPETYSGKLVCKSELNGKHDGFIVQGPATPKSGWVYQRLIDNTTPDGTVADLRCPTIGGAVPLVFIKERPIEKRFENLNTRCRLSTAEAHFSGEELEKISRFCQIMRLDFGGLDILRDNASGRLYIVDVNKTDMGPPLALPLREKLKSTSILAEQFKIMLETLKTQ